MARLRLTLAAAAVAFTLSTPAYAYSDEVVLAAIDLRVTEISAELKTLYADYQNASGSTKYTIKLKLVGLYARKVQLLRAAYYVRRLPESKNAYIISCYELQVASPAA